MKTKLNVAVIFGGKSVEHEISVISALQAINAIDKNKYRVIPIYITKQGMWISGKHLLEISNYKNMEKLIAKNTKVFISQNANECKIYKSGGFWGIRELATLDLVFPVLHGTHGEDGALQGLLELMNVPYVGCNVYASAITMDKIYTKRILREQGIPVLDDVWFYASEWIDNKDQVLASVTKKMKYPLIVKPGNLGSSIGVTSVNNLQELEAAIDLAASISQRILIEPKVENLKEVNCAVLGDSEFAEISVCEEPIRSSEILSYQDKYSGGNKTNKAFGKSSGMNSAKRKIPADISKKQEREIQDLARKAFINLNCSGVVRIDFLIDQVTKKIYLCELNTIPGSLSFYLWQPMGKNFTDLTERLIELAFKAHREKNNLILSYDSNILSNFANSPSKS